MSIRIKYKVQLLIARDEIKTVDISLMSPVSQGDYLIYDGMEFRITKATHREGEHCYLEAK